VFWITFEKRQWFSKLWKTRGANFMNIQIFGLMISIGLPWKNVYINVHNRDYRTLKHLKTTNDANLAKGILIGSYKKFGL